MSVQLENNAGSPERTWGNFTAKCSEAKPGTTLFGSSLEMQNDKQREEIKNTDGKSVSFRWKGGKKMFPQEHIFLPESAELLNHQKQVLSKQFDEAIQAKQATQEVEQQRKHFAENIEQAQPPEKPESQRSGKFTRSDLENALMMNYVGYNNGRSFNHHKYMPKPAQHQYALIGNAVQTGGDLVVDLNDYKRYPEEAYKTKPMGRRRKPLPEIPPNNQSKSFPEVLSAEDLPPNIRHQFGTMVCKSALDDPELVRESLLETRKAARQSLRPLLKPLQPKDIQEQKMDPNYESIGLTLRQNVFPGYTYDHKISHSKSTYSPDVYNRRQRDPDQWRYHKDELGTWAEKNFMHKQMKKAWEAYLLDTTKA